MDASSWERGCSLAFGDVTSLLAKPAHEGPIMIRQCHGTVPSQMQCILKPEQGGKKIALRGGGMARKPICPTPPSPSLVAVTGGGFGLALPYLPCPGGGGGSDPNIHGSK